MLFSFLEAALKRGPSAIAAEIKQLTSAQPKTHLTVHGGCRTMVEKENSVFKTEKVGLVFYTVPYSFNCKRVSVYLHYFSQYGVYDFTH